MIVPQFTPQQIELLEAARKERERLPEDAFEIKLLMDLDTAMAVVSHVKFAMRHPIADPAGHTYKLAEWFSKRVMEGLLAGGYSKNVELIETLFDAQEAQQPPPLYKQ